MNKNLKLGRPTRYSEELVAELCSRIASGKSLRTVCKAVDMPDKSTVFLWMSKMNDDGTRTYQTFLDQYAHACEERAEAYVEEIFDIADDASNDWMEDNYDKGKTPGYALNGENIQRSKLRTDVRKWYASKLKPRKYGEKLDMTTNGKDLPGPIMRLDDADK